MLPPTWRLCPAKLVAEAGLTQYKYSLVVTKLRDVDPKREGEVYEATSQCWEKTYWRGATPQECLEAATRSMSKGIKSMLEDGPLDKESDELIEREPAQVLTVRIDVD
jgi:hypothetical protein